jgi:hypothetical protein
MFMPEQVPIERNFPLWQCQFLVTSCSCLTPSSALEAWLWKVPWPGSDTLTRLLPSLWVPQAHRLLYPGAWVLIPGWGRACVAEEGEIEDQSLLLAQCRRTTARL